MPFHLTLVYLFVICIYIIHIILFSIVRCFLFFVFFLILLLLLLFCRGRRRPRCCCCSCFESQSSFFSVLRCSADRFWFCLCALGFSDDCVIPPNFHSILCFNLITENMS